MKILFSNLPWWEQTPTGLRQGIRAGSRWPFTREAFHAPDQFRFGGYLPVPFFLNMAASYTQRALPDSRVIVRDSIARGESYDAFMCALLDMEPDWLVIETATSSWEHDAALIHRIARHVDSNVILCGPMGAEKQAEAMKKKNVFAVVNGEYDKQIAKVIAGARGVVSHELLTIDEMNAAPLPLWDDAAALNYWDGCPIGHKPPQLTIWTSRGCPFRCNFCVFPATMTGNDPDGTGKRTVRNYSAEFIDRLLTERISWAKAKGAPYRSIYLDDDTANLNDAHTREMCGVMKKHGLPWSAMCRADTSSREVWQLMRDSGCFGVKIGMESGSQRVVSDIINKRLDIAKAVETCRWLKSIGMTVHTTWSIGHPGETPEEAQMTRDLIERMTQEGCHDTHQLSGTAEIDGTPLATLRKVGHLAKYPGAKVDENYLVSADGQRKIEGK